MEKGKCQPIWHCSRILDSISWVRASWIFLLGSPTDPCRKLDNTFGADDYLAKFETCMTRSYNLLPTSNERGKNSLFKYHMLARLKILNNVAVLKFLF